MKKGWVRVFAAVFTGFWAFFFLYSFIAWVLTFLQLTPYGRFVATFFKGRTKEEAGAFIEANRALFNEMLPEASRFANLYINPFVGLVAGFIIGLIYPKGRPKGAIIWSLVTVLPSVVMLWARSGADPYKIVYVLILGLFTALGGMLGNKYISRNMEEAV